MATMGFWIFLVKFLKHLRHFLRYPADVLYLPAIVLFGYVHCFIKLYAMTTLHVVSRIILTSNSIWYSLLMFLQQTAWGSREGADSHDSWRMIPLPSYQETPASTLPSLRPSSLTSAVISVNKSSGNWDTEPKALYSFPEACINLEGLLQDDSQLLHKQHQKTALEVVTNLYDLRMDDY